MSFNIGTSSTINATTADSVAKMDMALGKKWCLAVCYRCRLPLCAAAAGRRRRICVAVVSVLIIYFQISPPPCLRDIISHFYSISLSLSLILSLYQIPSHIPTTSRRYYQNLPSYGQEIFFPRRQLRHQKIHRQCLPCHGAE